MHPKTHSNYPQASDQLIGLPEIFLLALPRSEPQRLKLPNFTANPLSPKALPLCTGVVLPGVPQAPEENSSFGFR
jgi:hypothetical protein